jgi:hypothetical protein
MDSPSQPLGHRFILNPSLAALQIQKVSVQPGAIYATTEIKISETALTCAESNMVLE